jgi:predicted lysophospholipase L1 biosynthesis ABC-type transport system permease subunit
MGRLLLVSRLALRDLRRRPAEAVLLLIAITAAATTLTLGLVLHGVTSKPYQSTRAATAGPDVVVSAAPNPPEYRGGRADPGTLEPLARAPGVVRHSGPYPVVTQVDVRANGRSGTTIAQGRDTARAPVDQPRPTEGSWVRGGGVVVEAAFADVLGVGARDRITLNGRSFEVAGVAVTAAVPLYPEPSGLGGFWMNRVGLVWLTRANARSLAPTGEPLSYVSNLKLADPAAARAFVSAHTPRGTITRSDVAALGGEPPILRPWEEVEEANELLVRNQRRSLLTGSWLLGLLAVASIAVLVGGRMADQTRRVGLLKAVGGTPTMVAAVLLAEYVVVALFAAVAGVAVGWLAAPALTDPSTGLLGSAGAPDITAATVGIVTGVALAVAVAATFVPAVRAARTSTVLALADSARAPRRTGWLIRLSARLPVALLLGLRAAARRPRRVLLGVASIAITVSGLVAVLAAHADIADQGLTMSTALRDPRADRLNEVLALLSVTLVALAAVNAIFVTWATALDARHSSALARALGATPQEVSTGLSAAQVLPALAGALLGVPGGLALVAAVDPDGAPTPPAWQLLAAVVGTVVVVAALTSVPARISGRRPVAETLQAELA